MGGRTIYFGTLNFLTGDYLLIVFVVGSIVCSLSFSTTYTSEFSMFGLIRSSLVAAELVADN